MFSGIIEHLGKIRTIAYEKDSLEITVDTGMPDLSVGESVAVNGVCLTVTEIRGRSEASFFVSSETLTRTNLSKLSSGSRVNLERAVTPSTRLSGHIVQGHIDAPGRFIRSENVGEAHKLEFAFPIHLGKYLVEKGSIAIDGISLTINNIEVVQEAKDESEVVISVMIIPHTWMNTTLGHLNFNALVNVEVDIIAKYVENLCIPQK